MCVHKRNREVRKNASFITLSCHLSLQTFMIQYPHLTCLMSSSRHERACVWLSLLIADSDGRWETEKLEMKQKPEHRENNLVAELDGCRKLSFLYLLSFFPSLSRFLPSLRLFLQTLWRHQSVRESLHAHMYLRCVQMCIRSDHQLVVMCGGLLMIGFLLTHWCWWRQPCCFRSPLNQKRSLKNILISWTASLEKAEE